jgi:hypothetical protein
MSALNLRLPNSVHRHIKEIAKKDGVSINLFVTSAVSEKISALTTEDYIDNRAKHARQGAFTKVLDRVPRRRPLSGDELANKPSHRTAGSRADAVLRCR